MNQTYEVICKECGQPETRLGTTYIKTNFGGNVCVECKREKQRLRNWLRDNENGKVKDKKIIHKFKDFGDGKCWCGFAGDKHNKKANAPSPVI